MAAFLLLALILEALRGLLMGRIMALLGLCMLEAFGDVGGDAVAMTAAPRGPEGSGWLRARAPRMEDRDDIFLEVATINPKRCVCYQLERLVWQRNLGIYQQAGERIASIRMQGTRRDGR